MAADVLKCGPSRLSLVLYCSAMTNYGLSIYKLINVSQINDTARICLL